MAIGQFSFNRQWTNKLNTASHSPQGKRSPAAQRALAEAEARRLAAPKTESPKELGGRGGEDPVRYGDWEIKGLAADF